MKCIMVIFASFLLSSYVFQGFLPAISTASPATYSYEYWLPWSDNKWYNPSDLDNLLSFLISEDATIISIDKDHDGTYDVELYGNAGDVLVWGYELTSGLTEHPPIGTFIRSNKPISVQYVYWSFDYGIYEDSTYSYSVIPSFLLGNDYYIWTNSTVASLLSIEDNNTVYIDEDCDGSPEYGPITLEKGENYLYNNTKSGSHVQSTKKLSVVVVNWDASFDTETYAYEVYPANFMSDEYLIPYPNSGCEYYQYATDKTVIIVGSIYNDTEIFFDKNRDGVPDVSVTLREGDSYIFRDLMPQGRIYGNRPFYAIYLFDIYARDPWAGCYRDYMHAFSLPPSMLSGKQFIVYDTLEQQHVIFTSTNIYVLENSTEIYIDRGVDGIIDDSLIGNEGDVFNIIGKLPSYNNVTKIFSTKPITMTWSRCGGWYGISETTLGFTVIPMFPSEASPEIYSLTIITTAGGTTNPTPGTYTCIANSTVQVTAISNANYLFDHWELDNVNVGSTNPYIVIMDRNHTLKALFTYSPPPPQLSVSISPPSASILVSQSVTFTSTVSGGYTPYTYQWFLNGNPVSGATSENWTFTPTTSGINYVQLKVTDAKGNTVQSDVARVLAASVPVGGYSIPMQAPTRVELIIFYTALVATITTTFTIIKHKITRKTKKPE